jgi:hypothetical protein
VESRPQPQKNPILNSPTLFSFAIQRKIAKFLQEQKLHLVTLFPVEIRVLPFSEPHSKNPEKKTSPTPPKRPQFPHFLMVPFIKGLLADLILSVTRLL